MNLERIKKIYFIGIGGIMMSAAAKFFVWQGKEVSGSDRHRSEITEKLEKMGVKVHGGHALKNISNDIDLVIYTKAIDEKNLELQRARDLGLPIYSIHQFLGELSKGKYTIAVAGMHGKSTSTSMIGLIVEAAGLDPTVFVGTQIKEFGGNFRSGKSEYLVSEACEYKDNFLHYYPDIGVITNIEAEHLDYFKNISGVKKSFKQFVCQIKDGGWLAYNGDDEKTRSTVRTTGKNKMSFGIENDDLLIRAEDIKVDNEGVRFILKIKKDIKDIENIKDIIGSYDRVRFSLKLPGKFNVYNALAAICVAAVLGIKVQIVQETLAKFSGAWRRFEFKGEKDGVEYYDDYAHHPTEIKATLKAVKEKFGIKKVWIIYQPHLYSRTKDFMKEFAESLNLADNLILADIYAAREENKWGISSKDLAAKINRKYKRRNKVIYLGDLEKIEKFLAENVKVGEVVMTMGAGDVYKILNFKL